MRNIIKIINNPTLLISISIVFGIWMTAVSAVLYPYLGFPIFWLITPTILSITISLSKWIGEEICDADRSKKND